MSVLKVKSPPTKIILNFDTLEPKITINEDDFKRFYSRIKRSLKLGESMTQVANDTGISASTISTKLARMNTSVKEVRSSRPERHKKEQGNSNRATPLL